jgi:hypothetical protein
MTISNATIVASQIGRPERKASLDLLGTGSCDGAVFGVSPAGLFRDPPELPVLRGLRTNGVALQCRDRRRVSEAEREVTFNLEFV